MLPPAPPAPAAAGPIPAGPPEEAAPSSLPQTETAQSAPALLIIGTYAVGNPDLEDVCGHPAIRY